MDEVKKWDLEQLPGHEAIEEEPEEIEEDKEYETLDDYAKIKKLEEGIQETRKHILSLYDLAQEAEKEEKSN